MTSFVHKVRNCIDFDPALFVPGFTAPKLDGVRAFYYPGFDHLVSRQNKKLYGFDHIVDVLQESPWPVDMELVIPDMEFNKLSGRIRDHDSTPEASAHIIDIVRPGDLKKRLTSKHFNVLGPHVNSIPHFWCNSLDQLETCYETFLEAGYEGLVHKTLDHSYTNQRNWNWMRWVPVLSEDCEITGVYQGKGKMNGILGGFFIMFNGHKCKVGTLKGFDYAQRAEIWRNPDQYIGLTLEVEYKNLQPSGKPRQPRGKGLRYDK